MLNIDELRYDLQTLYLKKGYTNVSVGAAPRNQFPTEESPDVIRIIPPLPLVWDFPFPATTPQIAYLDLHAEWFENSFRKLRIWHGYCAENNTVYFAIERRYLEYLEI